MIREQYTEHRFMMTLTPKDRQICTEACMTCQEMIKDVVRDPNCLEWKVADFKQQALSNGWSVEDMPMLEALYTAYDQEPDGIRKEVAQAVINRVREEQISTLAHKENILDNMACYAESYIGEDNDLSEKLQTYVENVQQRKYAPTEFAEDKVFQENMKAEGYTDAYYVSSSKNENAIKVSNMLKERGLRHNQLSETRKNEQRMKETYILPGLTAEELETHKKNASQKNKGIKRFNRDVIKDIFGKDVYEDVDALYQGDKKEREVKIHHSRGSRQMDAGDHVFEMDFAGSGFSEARREHKGVHGKSTNLSDAEKEVYNLDEILDAQYGKKVTSIGNVKLPEDSLFRMKETERNGNKKTRISIPGPSSEHKESGFMNTGNYKIQNNVAAATGLIKQYLEPYMKEWKEHHNEPGYQMKPIRLNITGHSRGGVAAAETVKAVNQWLQEKCGPGSEYEGFAEHVHYDLLQRDPVPGPLTGILKVDLRGIPNMNSSTIYTTAADNSAAKIGFTPEAVRGQNRIILGTTPHSVGLEGADLSQLNVKGDEMAHQWGYLDTSTQEYYRGSGLADLPDGMYFSDEKRNLFRVESYSQIDKMIQGIRLSSTTWARCWAPTSTARASDSPN